MIEQLLESENLARCEVMIKSSQTENKVDVYNEIRALKNVVVCTVEQNEYLESKSTDKVEYSLLFLKYTLAGSPEDTLTSIRKDALVTNKVKGLLQFIPRFQTLEKL